VIPPANFIDILSIFLPSERIYLARNGGHCKRYRATGPESTWTWLHPQAALWDIPPNPATLYDRSAQRSKSWHSGSFAKYSDIVGLVTISFPACCVSHRATGLPVMVHDMRTRIRRPDYLKACPTGPPVEGVKSALTPALWPCAVLCHSHSWTVMRRRSTVGGALEMFSLPLPLPLLLPCAALWPCTFLQWPRNRRRDKSRECDEQGIMTNKLYHNANYYLFIEYATNAAQ